MRVFERMYSDPQTRPSVNLVFVLAGGSAIHNYEGVRTWFEKTFRGVKKQGDKQVSSSAV